MAKQLHIADWFFLPSDAVTETFGIVARRRAGKSYTARRIAEQIHKSGQQLVIIDPKGDWWGIRSSSSGKDPGLPIIILGGEHGDVKLETSGGEVAARLVVEERVSVLLDLSSFRKHELVTFMTSFLETLYRLKAQEKYRTPVMLIIDEADAIAPQKPIGRDEPRMLGAAEDIVRRGGQRGIGCTMVTQRSAVLNKNLLTQCQVLVTLRTIAPQDLGAIRAWIDVHGTPEQEKTLMESLPSLPTGDAWFWSPGWPTADGIFQRVHVLPIETFDSGATPKSGEKRVEPKNVADVDLDALRRQMADTIERSKQDDPRELRRQITSLKAELGKKAAPTSSSDDRKSIDHVSMLEDRRRRKEYEKSASDFHRRAEVFTHEFLKHLEEMSGMIERTRSFLEKLDPPALNMADSAPDLDPNRKADPPEQVKKTARVVSGEGSPMQKAERRILTALAQYPDGRAKRQVAILSVYAMGGGGFNNALSSLRTKGWINGYDPIKITEEGISALGSYEPLPAGKELLEYWRRQLGKAEREILDVLVEEYPDSMSKERIAEKTHTGYAPDGGGFNNALSRLRVLELVVGRGELKVSEDLFS